MTEFVIDASVVMAWCFEDESSAYAETVLRRLEEGTARVPALWPLEVGNVLVGAERRGRIEEGESERFLSLLSRLPIHVEPQEVRRTLGEVVSLARASGLTTYDASYLDLARRLGVPIATADRALARAADRWGVELLR